MLRKLPRKRIGLEFRGELAHCQAADVPAANQRGEFFHSGLALDDLDVLDGLSGRLVNRELARVTDLGDMCFVHSGMFPCFFGGTWVILRSSSRRAVAT